MAKIKLNQSSSGFTMIELLVGLTLGIIVLGGLVVIVFQTTAGMKQGIDQGQVTSNAQQALDQIVADLKNANSEAPQLIELDSALSGDWANLPHLPYKKVELTPYLNASGSTVLPTSPAARQFLHQSATSDPYYSWYPNPIEASSNEITLESNSIVFYKINRPAPGQPAIVSRITYRTLPDPKDANNLRLIREEQIPIAPGSTQYHLNPVPQYRVLAEQVLSMHFTYPDFSKKMEETSGAFENDLLALNATDREELLNSQYRKKIGLSLILKGAKIGDQRAKGIELKTEVKVRN